jgi:hypothetical protein
MENRDRVDPAPPRADTPLEGEERDDVDLVLRHVSRQFPEALARALVTTIYILANLLIDEGRARERERARSSELRPDPGQGDRR